MPDTLKPHDRISRYRVVGPIGAGGMGEVYEAQDQDLDRKVALKVLPRALVQNEERVKRFIREAKSASSLSHPHIVTIYEIGTDQVRPEGSGDVVSTSSEPPIHFISMELVTGKTLTDKIHDEHTDLKTLLGYLAQVADGLAKAHAAGIVHRDLKPSNIMITNDGYAKVLDFGLAKLTEQEHHESPGAVPEGATAARTFAADPTSAGMVLGTAGYMAPEQVAGKPVDARADIFAFGCILHEAATRRRAFQAATAVETMHQILHEQPAPIEGDNPDAPAALRRLIRRALAKDPDQRLQSMKDLAIELREIVTEYDTLTRTGSTSSGVYVPMSPGSRKSAGRRVLMTAIPVVIVAGLVLGAVKLWPGRGVKPTVTEPARPIEMSSLMSRADLRTIALSPDGRYLAYVSGPAGEQTLDILQVNTGSTVRVLQPRDQFVDALSFSADGDFLYFREDDPERVGYRSLFEVPSLGGTPTRKAFDVDTGISFAPDGRRGAFWRNVPTEGKALLVALELGSGQETILYTLEYPSEFRGNPAWSPDGKHVAMITVNESESAEAPARVVVLDVDSGKTSPLGGHFTSVTSATWLPDGQDLAVTGHTLWHQPQIFLLSYPEGRLRQVTNEIVGYQQVQVTADGKALGAMRLGRVANLWVQPVPDGESRPLTFHSGQATQVEAVEWGPHGEIIHQTIQDPNSYLWSVLPDGSGRSQLTKSTGGLTWDADPRMFSGNRFLLFERGDSVTTQIYQLDPAGGDVRRLTQGPPTYMVKTGSSAPDGSFLVWRGLTLWRVPAVGREPEQVNSGYQGSRGFSPDGRLIMVNNYDDSGVRYHMALPAAGGDPVARVRVPSGYRHEAWSADSKAITFTGVVDGVQGVYRQPLDGGPLIRITRIDDGQIREHRWSADGARVFFLVETPQATNVWIAPGEGGAARPLTRFPTGSVFEFEPSPDGAYLAFTYGTRNREVVMIENFR